jgi:hypothetical protein
MHAKKLQIALEYMIIFGFVLIVFLLLFTLVATQRAQTLSEQIFSEEQLVAQSVSAQLNRALQAGNGYVARVPITGAIGTLNYQLFVSKNGAVIVNASVGTQLLHVVAYSSVKNLVSSSSFLVPNTFFYQLPISNGTIFIQNSFGAICVDYACPTVSTQASNVTLSSELVHAALFATPNTQVQGIANALPYGTNAISAFAWIRTLATGKETAFSYGGTGSGQAASIDVSQQANTGNFYVDFGSDLADSMTPVNNGVWHFVGFSLASGSTSITLYVDGNTIPATLSTHPAITFASNYHIATWPNNAYGFNGLIANVQVYNGTLSSAQVNALYAQGIATQPAFGANIVGWWPLSGDPQDHSGTGFNGNVMGSVLFPSVDEVFAEVNNQQGYPLANALVGFSSTFGNFSTSQAITNITNANGIATAFVTQQQQNGEALVQATAFEGNQALQSSLMGWWPLSTGQGNAVYDISGHGDSGLLRNSAGWSSPNYVAGFSNKNSYIQIPASNSLQPTAQTWSFWFMPSSLASAQTIFGIGNTLKSTPTGIEAYITANQALGFNTMTQTCKTLSPLSNDTWYQGAVSWSGGTLKCYLNGMLQNSISSGFSGTITVNSPLYLGTDSFTPANNFFLGKIADFQVYNAVLQANQILQLYDQGIASPTLTPYNAVGWWPLDGDAYDYSGSWNNGSIYGNLDFVSSQINASIGNNATSIAVAELNGVNSLITTPLTQNVMSAFTIAFWVNPANAMRMGSANGYAVFNSFSANAISILLNNGGTLGSIPPNGDEELGVGATNVYHGYGISNSSWNFLAISISNGQANFYANGAPACTITIAGGPYSINALSIGGAIPGVSGYNGLISNVQIYNTTLGAGQISQIYQQGVAGAPLNNSAINFKLLAWYPLEGNANDYSGNGSNATTANVIYISQEAVRQAVPSPLAGSGVNFNGASSYANLGTSLALRPTSAVSVNLWMRVNGTSQNSASLLDDGVDTCVSSCSGYGLYLTNNILPTFAIGNGNQYSVIATQSVPYNWHMITGVYNGIAISIYVDGINVNSITSVPASIAYTSSCGGAPCNVILGDSSAHNAKFAGSISDVQIYNTGLSAAQVGNLYQSQTAPEANLTAPLGWYP